MPLRGPISALLGLLVTSCGGVHVAGRIVENHATTFRVGWLSSDWQRIKVHDSDLTYVHHGGGTIYADHGCQAAMRDVPLDVLTNQMLFDVQVERTIARKPITLDGREALRTSIIGQVDGVPIALDIVVLQKDGCVYDLVLTSSPDVVQDREPDFELFVNGFTTVS
jgi:hypothetical protein